MRGLVLANCDYLKHTSTEGNELQEGLRSAGWDLAGPGYDGIRNVGALLDRYQPTHVFVQDVRDWLPDSNISFRKDLGFENVELLGESGIPCFTVIKDAWGWQKEQSAIAKQINAAGIACYYRSEMVREVAPWIAKYPLLRIHHSVDADVIRPILQERGARRDALVSGFLQPCYPIREMAFKHAARLGLDVLKHPGYGNRGADTPNYLRRLAGYKVHLATSSQWGCAFRKIIESVACGMTPITNLPASDVLPEIDGALCRIPSNIAHSDLGFVIRDQVAVWKEEERMYWAEKALAYYDWRTSGERFSRLMENHVRN
jgi:hypothetical protein